MRNSHVTQGVESRLDADSRQLAHALIQSCIGPDHRVIDMQTFHSALVQALKDARLRGHDDCDVPTLT
jgi:hypothetical protein